ncbi:unnamed protein product [Owenia fusiformis]|uniref:Uncharacterized protein n=1 Tax=Owenia fusiformis TaxID=6347 RepID=A0A8J1TQ24_OWEFU|nr:unnamed protein product [Owenia fusiformis]
MMKEPKNTNSFGVVHFQPHNTDSGEIVLDIECGEKIAILYKEKLCLGSKGKCILHEERWLTPNEFQFISGRQSAKDWKRSIRHGGKSLKVLITKGYLTVHANGCECTSGAPHREKDANKGKKNKAVTFAINKEIERDELRLSDADEEITDYVTRQEDNGVGGEFRSPSPAETHDQFSQLNNDSKSPNVLKNNRLSLDSIIDRLRTSKGIDDGEVKDAEHTKPVFTAESQTRRENNNTSPPSPQMQIQNKRPAILSSEQSLKRRRSQEEHLSRHHAPSPEIKREIRYNGKYSDVYLTEAEQEALAYKARMIAYQSHLHDALTRPSKRSRPNKRVNNNRKNDHNPRWQLQGKCDVVTKNGYTFQREKVIAPSMFYDNNVPYNINGHFKTAEYQHEAIASAVPDFHQVEHLEAANRPIDLRKSNTVDSPLDLSKRGSPTSSSSLQEQDDTIKQKASDCKDVALAPLDLSTFKSYCAHHIQNLKEYGRNKRHYIPS